MKFKLSNNEPFQINGVVNNVPKTIDVLNDVANVIKVNGTLPAVAPKGTICMLNGYVIGDEVEDGGLIPNHTNFVIIYTPSVNASYDEFTYCECGGGPEDGGSIDRQTGELGTHWGGTPVEYYHIDNIEPNKNAIFIKDFMPNSSCSEYWSHLSSNEYVSVFYVTYNNGIYISNGETWQSLDSSSTPTIYCEVRNAAGDDENLGTVLIVKGADSFVNNGYVPILLRNSNKRNGRGWHHYKTSNNGDGGNSSFCSIDDVIVSNASGSHASSNVLTAKGVKLEDDFDILAYMPQANDNKVSHGKRTINLLRTSSKGGNSDLHVNFKAKWGLAFIKASDFPSDNVRLDISKLATNIAPFFVYYRWQREINDNWSLYTRLIT